MVFIYLLEIFTQWQALWNPAFLTLMFVMKYWVEVRNTEQVVFHGPVFRERVLLFSKPNQITTLSQEVLVLLLFYRCDILLWLIAAKEVLVGFRHKGWFTAEAIWTLHTLWFLEDWNFLIRCNRTTLLQDLLRCLSFRLCAFLDIRCQRQIAIWSAWSVHFDWLTLCFNLNLLIGGVAVDLLFRNSSGTRDAKIAHLGHIK